MIPTLAYSPCPNDTYIFAALTNGLIEAPPVTVVLDDVEALNAAAREGHHAFTKVSYGAIPYLTSTYRLLRSGGALGRGCGPLVVAKPDMSDAPKDLFALSRRALYAVPGELTTAYLLLRLALGFTPRTAIMRFDQIIDAVTSGDVDAGLIIHESRFTYQDRGLIAYADLGAWWEGETGKPIPLGAILARRDLDTATAMTYDAAIKASLRYARAHEAAILPYVREHASEMDENVMRRHIETYVNEFSNDVGEEGTAAVRALFARASAAQLIPANAIAEFV